MANQHPVIMTHGIFGWGPKEMGRYNYWGTAFIVSSPLERYESSLGPISSAHDRACELAAQIKGAPVDYGEQHSKEAGHTRYVKEYDYTGKGFVEKWDENNPIHVVAHSLGSPTVRCLQHLLGTDYWGWGSSHRWIKSITTLSGVANGSTATYFFGADEKTGLLKGVSLGTAILRMVEIYTYASGNPLEKIYDFDLYQWGFKRRPAESLEDYLVRLSKSKFMKGKDNACYTLTLQGAYEDNALWQTYPDTYYFAHITEQTFRGWFSGCYYAQADMNPGLIGTATYIGSKMFDRAPIPGPNFTSSDWWENDGLVSAYSQKYPHTNGHHPVGGEFAEDAPVSEFEPGKWYYKWERNVDHLDIAPFPQTTLIGWQKRFYTNLFERLAAL